MLCRAILLLFYHVRLWTILSETDENTVVKTGRAIN